MIYLDVDPGLNLLRRLMLYIMRHGDGETDTYGTGGRRTQWHHPGPTGDWAVRRGRQGGEAGMMLIETTEGGREPWTGEPWGQHRPGHRSRTARGGNWTGEGRHGLCEELLWTDRNGREAQTSGGAHREGVPSKWTVAPRLR